VRLVAARGLFCAREALVSTTDADAASRERESIVKIRPLQDRVLVKRLESEGKTKGGIIIPDSAKEKPIEGTVVAVGAGKYNDKGERVPLNVKPGEKILFGKYSGTEVMIDGDEHLMIREEDILGTIES
jgi:chaperonin GroES